MKKTVSILVALMLMLAIAAPAFAAANQITGALKPLDANNSSYNVGDAHPGDVVEFRLTADMFSWSGTAPAAGTAITRNQADDAKLGVKRTGSSALNTVIKSVELKKETKATKVVVTFADSYTGTSSKDFDFDIYLTMGKYAERQAKSVINFYGEFGNDVVDIDSDQSTYDISKGVFVKPSSTVREIELYLGAGVYCTTRLLPNKAYGGIAVDRDYDATDEKMWEKYSDITDMIKLKNASSLNISGAKFTFELGRSGTGYVYDGNGKYLGTADKGVVYATKYYITSKKIDMGGGVGTETSSSSSSTSSSSSSRPDEPTTKPEAGSSISATTATKDINAAIAAASGKSTVSVRYKDAGSLSLDALKAINSAAVKAGKTAYIYGDTMNGTAVTTRLYLRSNLNPGAAIKLGAYYDSTSVSTAKTKFEKWYSNKMAFVTTAHKGSFGGSVEIATKVDISKLNSNNLYFYVYDRGTNKFAQIAKPASYIDTSKFLHFVTTSGGDIIISEGPLKLK